MKRVILALTLLTLPTGALAQGDTPVTAIANPQATSSGSVVNQAVQVMQGPYTTNSYGSGVQCQGPTLNFTPFINQSYSGTWGDGDPASSFAISPGASMTVSVPLDRQLQNLCKEAARNVAARHQAETDKARLDFELVRLLRCGEAIKAGVTFHPNSPYATICSDVVVASQGQR